jgi:hypothetical protein
VKVEESDNKICKEQFMSFYFTVKKSEEFIIAQIDRYDKKKKSNDGNNLHFSSVCSFRFNREREGTVLIKYKFSDEVIKVNVKKRGRPSQKKSITEKVFSCWLMQKS